ncbi:MAG TPA: hypothetical protein VJ755_01045 [Gemmatimonadales bacterium]|nr:hypothetical protein [Gemmatimonadales bacterium]
MRVVTLTVALVFGTSCVAAARTQSKASTKSAVGVEIGTMGVSGTDESLFQLGLRVRPQQGGYGSVDFSFATFPDALSSDAFLFLMDLGITYGAPKDSSPVYVFPHGGASLLACAGLSNGSCGGAVAGYNVGAGLLVRASPKLGIGFDYTYRRTLSLGGVGAHSMTFGLMFLH